MPDNLPDKLFKYRSWSERTRSILLDHTLYFASPFEFNDPFDCGLDVLCSGTGNEQMIQAVAFDQVRKKFPAMPRGELVECAQQIGDKIVKEHLDDVRHTFVDRVALEVTSRCGIFCLSGVNDNILMWSHYTDCHNGICLEFSVSGTPQPFENLNPVTYSDDFPSINLHELVQNESLRQAGPWMLTKAKQWGYEKEWRALNFSGPGAKPFDPKTLTGVILGCRMPNQIRNEVRAIIEKSEHPVELFETRMASNQFRLEICRIS